ncbi:hypothetical protein [Parabacteroides johnsonii]|uniref:hypothetical protein n=2 Tax=Parabacteroides johnsonii TaxID=387661 RepID=UPI00101D5A42|nr:hypothetical protein [Parabacteroides johnsonii]
MNIYALSFADSRMSPSLSRLRKQIEQFDLFSNYYLFDENALDDSFKEKHKDHLILGSRGFGYWVWKPYLILKTLEQIPDGDFLLYMDVGCHLNVKGKKRFMEYIRLLGESKIGILSMVLDYEERLWTKGDLFDLLGVRNDKNFTETKHRAATFLLIRNSKFSRAFVSKWLNVYEQGWNYVDDTESVSPNLDGFREHRHDQSVFSVLSKFYDVQLISAEESFPLAKNPIWTLRDKKMKLIYRYSLRRFLSKCIDKIKHCK